MLITDSMIEKAAKMNLRQNLWNHDGFFFMLTILNNRCFEYSMHIILILSSGVYLMTLAFLFSVL
jgi:hypothetical protein